MESLHGYLTKIFLGMEAELAAPGGLQNLDPAMREGYAALRRWTVEGQRALQITRDSRSPVLSSDRLLATATLRSPSAAYLMPEGDALIVWARYEAHEAIPVRGCTSALDYTHPTLTFFAKVSAEDWVGSAFNLDVHRTFDLIPWPTRKHAPPSKMQEATNRIVRKTLPYFYSDIEAPTINEWVRIQGDA